MATIVIALAMPVVCIGLAFLMWKCDERGACDNRG